MARGMLDNFCPSTHSSVSLGDIDGLEHLDNSYARLVRTDEGRVQAMGGLGESRIYATWSLVAR